MDRYVGDTEGHLPEEFFPAHDLCFLLYDVMAELLASGERNNVFSGKVDIKPGQEFLPHRFSRP